MFFPNASRKLDLSALPKSPLERASKYIADDANGDTYQYTVLVHIYI